MRILIVTQSVDQDDSILGFFHRWIEEFSKHAEEVKVVCLKEGKHNLPSKVEVFSLGKENISGSLFSKRLRYTFRFLLYIIKNRNEYDSVFVHMNPEYVVLGGIFWRMMGKKITLWYTHRQVTLKLRIATLLSDVILTATPESFILKSAKVHFIGHGIDTKIFGSVFKSDKLLNDPIRIMSVGRITPIKNPDIILEALSILKKEGLAFEATIIGSPSVDSDHLYLESLKKDVSRMSLGKEVKFLGSVSPDKMKEQYAWHDISVNLTPTGGLDKVVLESMASGTIPITSNKAFRSLFGEYWSMLICDEHNSQSLAFLIKKLINYKDIISLRTFLKRKVDQKGSVNLIVERIFSYL